ncbi:unnamed protein product [Rotaria sp. Silwood2]|nr:unnamed protein product [Rotaria sp. Silwood2]CAF4464866.1 unnamed protein product [Rotaria sp. Silwood2]
MFNNMSDDFIPEIPEEFILVRAAELARTNVNAAMDTIRDDMPLDFSKNRINYLKELNHIFVREQEERMNRLEHLIFKTHDWPESFSDCTPALRRVVNRWVKQELRRTSGVKCLILIGPFGTGKTCFAKSLPGYYNYFDGQWRLDIWKNFTSYSIFDNIGWDEFEEKGFPNKKHILTQRGYFKVPHETGVLIEINCTQPAIVLLNQGLHEGQLGRPPIEYEEEREAKFWEEHAIIYRMGKHTFSFHPTEFKSLYTSFLC